LSLNFKALKAQPYFLQNWRISTPNWQTVARSSTPWNAN